MANVIINSKEIPLKRIAELLVGAFEGGSNSWCTITQYQKPPVPQPVLEEGETNPTIYRHVDYPLQLGGALVLKADEDPKVYILHLMAIHQGCQAMADTYPDQWATFLMEQDDACTSDTFLQCCLFGKLVYG